LTNTCVNAFTAGAELVIVTSPEAASNDTVIPTPEDILITPVGHSIRRLTRNVLYVC
jgi:hypothetical protein